MSKFGSGARAARDYEFLEGSIQCTEEPYTCILKGLEVDRVASIGNIVPLSANFLRPLFLAFQALNECSNFRIEIGVQGTDQLVTDCPVISEYEFQQLSGRLLHLINAFKDAARSENIDYGLLSFLYPLFSMDTRPRLGRITYYEIHKDTIDDPNMRVLLDHLYEANSIKQYFTTEQGRFGLGRVDIREGDRVCVLWGGTEPYLLRKEGDHHVFVGNCFCHGLMLGEAVEDFKEGKVNLQEFVLH